MSNEAIRESVKAHYGSIAISGSCCGDTSCCRDNTHALNLYERPADVNTLPLDVTSLSLGCGDPVTIASLKPGETVLDLGSGAGIDCFMASWQVGDSGYVIGVDMTPAMLEKANTNKAKMSVSNVEFRQGYIESLPIESNVVDVIMSNCVINLSPDKAAVFRESFRVLKPGGRVAVSDIVIEGEFTQEQRENAASWSACVSGAIDVNEYTRLMYEEGFVNIVVKDKVNATERGVDLTPASGTPRIYSARITADKPL